MRKTAICPLAAAIVICGAIPAFGQQAESHEHGIESRTGMMEPQEGEGRARAKAESLGSEESTIEISSETSLERGISASDRSAVSFAAGRLLIHVDSAREAIREKNKENAVGHVEKAETLARIIERSMPVYSINTTIKSGDLEYSSEDQVPSRLVTVYSELGRVVIVGPIAAAKSLERDAQTHQQPSQSQSQGTEGFRPAGVRDVNQMATTIELNVGMAADHIQAALSALKSDDMERADAALQAVQSGVVLSFVSADLPLVEAQDNLMLARMYAKEGRTDEARRLLGKASSALRSYEQTAGEGRAAEVKEVRKEIESMERSAKTGDDSMTTKIASWWNDISNWMTRTF